ncbi:MAG: D-alanine--D-alanine ligase [Alphaproteobacteria bacterium]|nr:D-alanine--D-alanine ligase [Alphaproteobacteria bacterium]
MAQKILLLYGGFSAEREVSISAKDDISSALKSKGYEVIEHNLVSVYNLLETIKETKPDAVYNGLYGNWGEDGEIQSLFDMLQIPYTHSSAKSSVLGMDKDLSRLIAAQNGVKIARGVKTTFAEYQKNGSPIKFPYVVKPVADGSSVGVFIVKNKQDAQKVNYLSSDTEILVEEYITGREFTVMCLEGKAYCVTELKAKKEFYDYEAKYTSGMTEHILPAPIDDDVANTCKRYAEIMHNALDCNTISRCDFRYNEQDGVVFLEINTNPGMTKLSLVPEQARYVGISYADLCDKLVKNASCRKMK